MPKKKKVKKDKKKKLRTQEERASEINTLRTKITSIGFPYDNDGIVQLFSIFERYVETGEPWSGEIPLRGFQRVCVVRLTNIKNFKNIVTLKFNAEV